MNNLLNSPETLLENQVVLQKLCEIKGGRQTMQQSESLSHIVRAAPFVLSCRLTSYYPADREPPTTSTGYEFTILRRLVLPAGLGQHRKRYFPRGRRLTR